MTADQKKKPGVAFWATVVVVVVLAAYPLSYGPVLWINRAVGAPEWVETAENYFYFPIGWLDDNAPRFGDFSIIPAHCRAARG